MKTTQRTTLMVTAAILGLGCLGAVAAVPTTGQAMSTAHASMTTAAPQTMPQTMTERVNHRIATLHAALLITPAQAPQWNHFVAVMRQNAHDIDRTMRQRIDRLPTMNAEQNMQSYLHVAIVHAQSMRKLLPAFDHLYSTMSPSQKATADRVFRNDAYRGKPARQG